MLQKTKIYYNYRNWINNNKTAIFTNHTAKYNKVDRIYIRSTLLLGYAVEKNILEYVGLCCPFCVH